MIDHAETRTRLAWQRSSLPFFLVGLAIAKGATNPGIRAHLTAGVVIIALGMVVAAVSGWSAHRRAHDDGQQLRPATTADIRLVAATTAAIGVVSVAIVIIVSLT